MKILVYSCKFIFISIALIVATSCSDFLEENPKDFRTAENSYKDGESLKVGLIGAYSLLKRSYRSNSFLIGVLGTDEAMGQPNTIYNNLSRYQLPPNDSHYIFDFYNVHFKVIAQANTLIDAGSNLEQNEEIRYIINESKFLRAFAYFRLVQVFGPVPLVVEPTEGAVDYAMPRNSLSDIYKQIINDLKDASKEGALPEDVPQNVPQHPSRYIAKAFLGKVYLTLASTIETGVIDNILSSIGKKSFGFENTDDTYKEIYSSAEKVLGEVINSDKFQLNNNYGELFTIENDNKINENMWQIQFSTQLDNGNYFRMTMGMWTENGDLDERVNTNALGLCQITYPKSMWTSYSDQDVRKKWNLACKIYHWDEDRYEVGDPLDGDVDGEIASIYNCIVKFRYSTEMDFHEPTSYDDIWNKPTNITVMRYADVLLMFAEANLKTNDGTPTQKGVNAINLIRQRARGYHEDGTPISVSEKPSLIDYSVGNLNFDLILEERKLELSFEGYRWFDLVRTGKLIEKYNEPVYPQSKPFMQQIELTKNHYLFPLPQTEIDGTTNSDGFFQNPGY